MQLDQLSLNNLDLLSVGITIAGMAILGAVVFLNNPSSITNKSFLLFSTLSVLWGVTNYLNYKFESAGTVLLALRLLIFLGTWHALSLFQLLYVFPKEKVVFSRKYKFILLPTVVIVSLLTLTPLVFRDITYLAVVGQVSTVSKGPGILAFVSLVAFLFVSAFYMLFKKIRKSEGLEKKQLSTIFIGLIITFFLLATFNFLLPALFDELGAMPLGALFIFPFIAFTSYAIIRHGLLNIKVVATEILTFILAVVTFLEIIFADELSQIIFRSSVFTLVLVFGILLIRSVRREVEQREKIEILAGELSVANSKLRELDKQKTEFLSIASHQLRAPLTAIKGYSSMLLENSFGEIGERAKSAVDVIFQSSRKLVTVIEDFLNIAQIELGQMKYEMTEVDMRKLVETAVGELSHQVELKGLTLKVEIPVDLDFKIKADAGKMAQVLTNLIDNAVKYTKQGSITVSLSRLVGPRKIRLAIADTGIGLTAGTHAKLFEKFTRARDASKTNIVGTGLGLYVAKQIVEAHNGRVWAESPGPNRGSTFYVEI